MSNPAPQPRASEITKTATLISLLTDASREKTDDADRHKDRECNVTEHAQTPLTENARAG
jgi:hypothetical protein